MDVDLFAREGGFVTKVSIFPYQTMPDAIFWGERMFIRRPDEKYYEGFVHVVTPPQAPRPQ